jgi:transcription antitermination factor NusA-like protein
LVCQAEATDRRFIKNLFFPAKVISVNLIWLPDGSKSTKVIISTPSKPKSQLYIEKIKKIAKEIRNIDLLVEFEHQK